jgi:hypothetical protein
MKRSPEIEDWLGRLDGEQREQAEWLAGTVEDAVPEAEAAIKWKRLTFTLDGDWHHWLCAVAASGAGVRLVFHKGVLLEDADGLLAGDGRYLRETLYADAVANPEGLAALLRQATERRTEMLE